MPNKKLKKQDETSCAAHCTVVAIAELLGKDEILTNHYAEKILWPEIQFKDNGSPQVKHLAELKNSDPRKIVKQTDLWWAEVKATLLCDETQKNIALTDVPEDKAPDLGALFKMIMGTNPTTNIQPDAGIYYNASYLMFENDSFAGLHNILVTKSLSENPRAFKCDVSARKV